VTTTGAGLSEAPPAARRRETVAVVIPTLNVEQILPRCLDSVRWADEVIVVDMFSTDGTVDVCRRYPNVRLFQRRDYIFGNVNFGFDRATTDWVIRLDSDEVPDERLQASIQAVLREGDPAIPGYYFPSVQYMFGRPMRWGPGVPERTLRKCMFRRGTARYECRAEHEEITAPDGLGVLEGCYHHYTNATAAEIIAKFDYYTDRDVERMDPALIPRPSARRVLYRAARMFLLYYLQWRGYRDGLLGLFSSLFRGPVYVIIEEAKLWEAWSRHHRR